MAMIKRIDHLNVQVPPEKEAEGKHFYGTLLGLKRLRKPDSLGPAGAHYCISEEPWYELHLGVARDTTVADINRNLRNHLGFQVDDLAAARKSFEEAALTSWRPAPPIPRRGISTRNASSCSTPAATASRSWSRAALTPRRINQSFHYANSASHPILG